jgi:hypothetical protein
LLIIASGNGSTFYGCSVEQLRMLVYNCRWQQHRRQQSTAFVSRRSQSVHILSNDCNWAADAISCQQTIFQPLLLLVSLWL